jgi:cytochrome c biogenesis factor
MYFWPGVFALWGALFAGLASMYFYFRADRGHAEALPAARSAYAAFATCIVAAAGTLMALLLQHRFDVSYVNSYSSRELPSTSRLHVRAGQRAVPVGVWGAIIGLFVWRSRAGSARDDRVPRDVRRIVDICKQSLLGCPSADPVTVSD